MVKTNKGKIITITSSRGGNGKSTISLLLASVYANLKKKVLLMDLDLYSGSIAFSLNIDTKSNIFTLCDDISNNRCKLTELGNYTYKFNDYISILSAPKDPRQANKIDKSCLEVLFTNLPYEYDVIVIDTNHVLNYTNMLAYDNSDSLVNVFTNDAVDIKGTSSFVSICKNIDMDSLVLVQNNASTLNKKYFSNYDIKNVIDKNIDYIISENYYVKNYDAQIMDGSLIKYFSNTKIKGYNDVVKMALKLLEDKKGADEDEKN